MEAKELRLSNFVIDNTDMTNPNQVAQITAIEPNRISTDKGYFPYSSLSNIEPIPLTEEWLVKFGFEVSYKSDYNIKYSHIKHDNFTYRFIRPENKSWLEYYGGAIKCDYIHQLQNLFFALTGNELTLK